MIHVHVKHYLNEAGMRHFDDWFSRVYRFMSVQTGFHALSSKKLAAEGMVYIKLTFRDEKTLDAWIAFPEHDQLVRELDQYRSRNYWEVCRTSDDSLHWRQAEYQKILAEPPVAASASSLSPR